MTEEGAATPRPRSRRRPSSAPASTEHKEAQLAAGGDGDGGGGSESVRVYVRVRPRKPDEEGGFLNRIGSDVLRVQVSAEAKGNGGAGGHNSTDQSKPGHGTVEPKLFAMHGVLDEGTTQANVYEAVGPLVIDSVRRGYNATIFAYGQTGTGKTHTMLGTAGGSSSLPSELAAAAGGRLADGAGVIPRAFDELFNWLEEGAGPEGQALDATVQCSVAEIYMEKITDLLQPRGQLLSLRDANGSSFVKGLSWHEVHSAKHVLRLLDRAIASRQTAATKMNQASSRSHMVLQARVELRETVVEASSGEGGGAGSGGGAAGGGAAASGGAVRIRTSLLSFVDLAGSERQKTAGTEGDRLAEGAAINKSLLALSKVIYALASPHTAGNAMHVPYRDSVLTRLLQSSLGGNSRTVLLATISPDRASMAETLSTLEFAQRAKFVVNRAIASDVVQSASGAGAAELQERDARIAALLQQLEAMKAAAAAGGGAAGPGAWAAGAAGAGGGGGMGGGLAGPPGQPGASLAEVQERDARIASLTQQVGAMEAKAVEQKQLAGRQAEQLAQAAAAAAEAAQQVKQLQEQLQAATAGQQRAAELHAFTAAQLAQRDAELHEIKEELEQIRRTEQLLSQSLSQSTGSNADLSKALQLERQEHAEAMAALRAQAAAAEQAAAMQYAALKAQLAGMERAQEQHAGTLQAAERQVERLQEQLERQASTLQHERSSWQLERSELRGAMEKAAQQVAAQQVAAQQAAVQLAAAQQAATQQAAAQQAAAQQAAVQHAAQQAAQQVAAAQQAAARLATYTQEHSPPQGHDAFPRPDRTREGGWGRTLPLQASMPTAPQHVTEDWLTAQEQLVSQLQVALGGGTNAAGSFAQHQPDSAVLAGKHAKEGAVAGRSYGQGDSTRGTTPHRMSQQGQESQWLRQDRAVSRWGLGYESNFLGPHSNLDMESTNTGQEFD